MENRPNEPTNQWLNVTEAARRARVGRGSVYRAVSRRELQHVRVAGGRSIRTTAGWVDEWLRRFTAAVEGGEHHDV